MKFLALALFVGVALCNSSAYYGWAPQKEYIYRFESQLLTGIPEIRSQYAGLKLASEVRVQAFSDYTLRIKFENPKFVVVNEELQIVDGRAQVPKPHRELPEDLAGPLKKPFEARLKRGVVESLIVERDEPVVITNIKKALLSQIQMDLSGSRRTEIDSNAVRQGENASGETSYFTTEERTIVGDCQTSYTINPLPKYQANEIENRWAVEEKELHEFGVVAGRESSGEQACRGKQYYEITKTKNFDNCKERPIYQAVSGIKNSCDASKASCKDTMTHMSSSRYIVCGSPEQFTIREATTDNTVVVNPMGWNTQEKMMSTARVTLFLIKAESYNSPMPKPQEPKEVESLIFQFPLNHKDSSRSATKQVDRENEEQSEGSFEPIMPQPDMRSASRLIPSPLPKEELRSKIVAELKKIVREIFESPESCSAEADVAGHISTIAQYLRPESYESLKEIEEELKHAFSEEKSRKIAMELFDDIVSMVGSNPATLLIKSKIVERRLTGSKAATVLRNTIANVRTPTKELLKELLSVVKSVKSSEPQVHNAGIIELSNLVYAACVNPSTATTQFPVRIFGRFCSKDSEIIKEELIPYLEHQLSETENETERYVLIAALGKIGEKKALLPLVKVIEGKLSKSPMTRSLAVYALKRLAKRQPAVVRPIMLALIDNPAENTQVRIAAVAILPWTQPSVAELQKIAVRSWFEPSKQVASFIYSTLKNLPSTEVPELKPVGVKAKTLLSLVKPQQYGVQFSQNAHSNKFVEYLRSATSSELSYVNTEDEVVPARVAFSSNVFTGLAEVNQLSWSVYTQGMDKVMDKAAEVLGYKSETSERVRAELERINQRLNIKQRESESPAALIQLRMLGLERFYALDHRSYSEIVEKLSEELRSNPELFAEGRHFHRAASYIAMSSEILAPSDAGFLVFVQKTVPVVVAVKGSITVEGGLSASSPKAVSAQLTPVLNVKIETNMGVLSPFSKQLIASGVEVSVHSAASTRIELESRKRGQVTIALKTPQESRKEIELIHAFVKPYTTAKDVRRVEPISKAPSTKKVLSGRPVVEFSKKLGESLGLEATLHVATDYKSQALATLLQRASEHNIMSALATGAYIPSLRYSSAKVTFNPEASATKEIKTVISVASAGRFESSSESSEEEESVEVSYPEEHSRAIEREIEETCSENHRSPYEVEECKQRQTEALNEESEQARRVCEEADEARQHGYETRSEKELCQKTVKVCEQAKQACKESGRHEHAKCEEKKEECLARHHAILRVHQMLKNKLEGHGSASVVHVESSLHSQYGRQHTIKTIAVAGSTKKGREMKSYFTVEVAAPNYPAYEIELESNIKLPQVMSRWNIQSLLEEPVQMEAEFSAKYGRSNGEKHELVVESNLSKTQAQQESVRRSPEYRKCEEEEHKGLALSSVCMEVRHQAASVDKIQLKIRVPKALKYSPVLKKIEAAVKGYFLSNLQEEAEGSEESDEINATALFSRRGEEAQLKVRTPSGARWELKNVRIPVPVRGVLPLSLRNGVVPRLVQKITRDQEPASCRVEPEWISTFDNKTYKYSLNSCEHLLFKDCSNKRPLAVLVEGPSSSHKNVKILAGTNEVVLNWGSRSASGIKINGEHKNLPTGERIVKRSPESGKVVLVIFRNKDNVISVSNPVEGLQVFSDGKRIEIVAPQMLHNRACGLCGDLNGENTADLKSPEKCLMSRSRFNAYSYMMKTAGCPGIPESDVSRYQRERNQCVKARSIPTPLEKLARAVYSPKPISRAHSLVWEENQVCISKQQVKVCAGSSMPLKVKTAELEFACLTWPSAKAQQIVERAEAGEIVDEVAALPTAFTQKQKEAVRCTGGSGSGSGSGSEYEESRYSEESRRNSEESRRNNYRNQPRY